MYHTVQRYKAKIWIRIRISVKKWIRNGIPIEVESRIRFRKRIKVKRWIRIQIKVLQIRKPKECFLLMKTSHCDRWYGVR
jgi:hypothetical protein